MAKLVRSKEVSVLVPRSKTMTWIKLNVGGTMFETSRETLLKFPKSKLAELFKFDSEYDQVMVSGEEEITNNNVYNVDLDPTYFSVVLSWLR